MKINFHTKIFIALGLTVCLSMVSILFILQETTENRIKDNIIKKFESTRVALRQLQEFRNRYAVDAINTLTVSNAQFRSILSTASVSGYELGLGKDDNEDAILKDTNLRLNSLLPFLSLYKKCDVIILTNAEGVLLFSKMSPKRFGDDLSYLPLFEELIVKGDEVNIWDACRQSGRDFLFPVREKDTVCQVIAKPVVFRGEVHGVVICGSRIDEDILLRLKSVSGVDLALYCTEDVHASTLLPARTQTLATFIRSSDFRGKNTVHEFYFDKEKFLSMRFPIIPEMPLEEGGLIVLKSLTQELKFISQLRITLLIVGGVILSIAIGFSFLLSKGITKPIKKLALASRDIGMGKLDTKVNIRTGDELEKLGNAFNGMVKGLKERDFIKSTFERYVSHTVAAEIIRNPDMLRLGGERKPLTIFFTDIGDFTNLSEMLSPEDVVRNLNTYFRGMTAAILEYNGTINKFQGDAIFAFWGAPIPQENHALLACKAALRCLGFLDYLEKMWVAWGYPPRTYRFGISTGEVVVGNIGTSSRFEYTIIGDDVNIASRLEGVNKHYGTQILISEKTYSLIKDKLIAREIDIIRAAGKSKSVKIYELVAEKGKIDERKAQAFEHFEAGIHAYRSRQWEAAISCFTQVLRLTPEDKPARLYIQRCIEYQQIEPAQDWDGVYEFTEK
ncbi:MAG: adenylate/guanylate cyclase domain-containing protein [Candidatus Scalinduaceae bacterium]